MEIRKVGYTVISPEAGSFNDLQLNAKLAHQARAQHIRGIKAGVDRFLETSRRVSLSMKEKFPDLSDPKAIEPEMYKAMIIEQIVERNGFTPGRKYNFDMTDRLDPHQKKDLLEKPVERLREIAASVDVEVPGRLIDRVRVIDEESFWALLLWKDGDNQYGEYGTFAFTMRNRICAINEGAIRNHVANSGDSFEDTVRNVGVHEIWHSLGYGEDWNTPRKKGPFGQSIGSQTTRRSGLVVNNGRRVGKDFMEDHLGLISVDEGLANIVTAQALTAESSPVINLGHEGEIEITRQLINVVGIEPLLRATLTKSGFRDFASLIDGIYGRGALRRFTEVLSIDRGARGLASMMGEDVEFQTTKNFLETGQVIIPE